MIGVHRRSSAVVLVLALSACARLEWQKHGADPAAMQRDRSECQDSARLRARNEAPLFGQPQPAPIGMDSRGRIVTGYAARYDTERALMENDFTRACMQNRGYELAPLKKAVMSDG